MDADEFKKMDAESIADAILYAGTPDEVDSLFEKLSSLRPADCLNVTGILEQEVIDICSGLLSDDEGRKKILDVIKAVESSPDAEAHLQFIQAKSQIVFQIWRVKGDTTHILIQTFAKKIGTMPDDQYQSCAGHLKAILETYDAAHASASPKRQPKTAPFRLQ